MMSDRLGRKRDVGPRYDVLLSERHRSGRIFRRLVAQGQRRNLLTQLSQTITSPRFAALSRFSSKLVVFATAFTTSASWAEWLRAVKRLVRLGGRLSDIGEDAEPVGCHIVNGAAPEPWMWLTRGSEFGMRNICVPTCFWACRYVWHLVVIVAVVARWLRHGRL
jgi:hypothetical protein